MTFVAPLFRWFASHWLALILAAIVGGFSVAPHVIATRMLGSQYRGIPFMYLDNEDYYIARVQEIRDGHWPAGSPFLFEGKDASAVQPATGELIFYVLPSKLFGLSAISFAVFSKFLFPAMLFLLVYWLVLLMTVERESAGQRLSAIVAGLLSTIGYQFAPLSSFEAYFLGAATPTDLSIWTRPVNPVTGGLLLFLCLICLWKLFSNKLWKSALIGGVLIGASSFYLFSWAISITVAALLTVVAVIKKDAALVKRLFVLGLLGTAPFFYFMYSLFRISGDDGMQASFRQGLLLTRAPLLNKTLLACLVVFLVLSLLSAWRERKSGKSFFLEPWWIFCFTMIIGGLAVLNQQLLTGRTVWPYHFVQYTKPMTYIVLVIIFTKTIRPISEVAWKTVLLFISFAVFVNALVMTSGTFSALPAFAALQSDSDVYNWVRLYAPKDCVILTDPTNTRHAQWIPAFTSCNVYLTHYTLSGVSTERMLHNFYFWMRQNDVTEESAYSFLQDHQGEILEAFFEDWRELYGQRPNNALTRKRTELVSGYAEFLKTPFQESLHKYRVDYFLTGEPLSEEKLRLYGVREKLFEFDGSYLYAF